MGFSVFSLLIISSFYSSEKIFFGFKAAFAVLGWALMAFTKFRYEFDGRFGKYEEKLVKMEYRKKSSTAVVRIMRQLSSISNKSRKNSTTEVSIKYKSLLIFFGTIWNEFDFHVEFLWAIFVKRIHGFEIQD